MRNNESHQAGRLFADFAHAFGAVLCVSLLVLCEPVAAQTCVADCDGSGRISVDELVLGVNIAVARADLESCPVLDLNGDDKLTIDELTSAVFDALTGCGPSVFCASLPSPVEIPDSGPPVELEISIAATQSIRDLAVRLRIDHTFVGDLAVTLRHVDTNQEVALLDRPGASSVTPAGCEGDDIDCTLNDLAASAAEDTCANTAPAIGGRLRPREPLGVFVGEDRAGTWVLTVSDNATGDVGEVVAWCLEIGN